MKLFWGLIETETPHRHTFDSSKWEEVCVMERLKRNAHYEWPIGNIAYHQNTCLTCGDLVEREMDRTNGC